MQGHIEDETGAMAALLANADPANGDDAARLRLPGSTACISTDSTVAGVHAPAGTTPHELGRRAAARALSDLAAMGARPVAVTCAVLVPDGCWDDAIHAVAGARARAVEQGARLVGGDLTRSGGGPLALVLTVVGTRTGARATFVGRDGARPGDGLWVTGTLGAATAALGRGDRCLPEPPDRIRAGIVLARHANAMLDLSDGLARDARNLAMSSRCAAELVLDDLPLAQDVSDAETAALGGDDYELLVALPPGREAAALAGLRSDGLEAGLTSIGTVADGPPSVSFLREGSVVELGDGFAHC